VRLGTPAITTRGFGEPEMREVAELIHEAIVARDQPERVARTRERAIALATRFPLPGVHLSPNLKPQPELAR
jgi:glycine hydroxymethyltransferase